jgi:DNA processing protein
LASGSLISARIAADLGREVFAIPGSIHSPLAKGCHHLIKQGAKLVESAADVLEELQLPPAATEAQPPPIGENPDHRAVLLALEHTACAAEVLAQRANLPVPRVLAALTELEINGDVARVSGGLFQRLM